MSVPVSRTLGDLVELLSEAEAQDDQPGQRLLLFVIAKVAREGRPKAREQLCAVTPFAPEWHNAILHTLEREG